MKRNFTQDSLEDFLKQSADSLRMKAPERVWQNLSKELNKKRRRFAFGLSALLLFTSTAGYYVVTGNVPEQKISAHNDKQPTMSSQAVAGKDESVKPILPAKEAKVVFMQPKHNTPAANFAAVHKNTKTLAPVIGINSKRQRDETAGDLPNNERVAQNSFASTVVDSYPEGETQAAAATTEAKGLLQKSSETFPLTIESVVNAYKNKQKATRFETQLYVTPTISYRKLTENKSYLRGLDPASIPAGYPALYSSVNSYVTHKPAVGFELGTTVKYALSNSVKLRAGLQFNINRYDVKAFSSSGSMATITLNNGSRIDSLNTYSRYSNLPGSKSDWLQNLSFQLSVPVGVEYLFKGDDNIHFGIAATVQPTYVVGDRAYLITTDYKNYTEVPWLIRRWNVNTSLETFIAYKRWQVGPQVRYQLLSSFVSRYPVKENLFDFGLKIGVKLNK